jgi:hypothetical protein
MCILAQSHQCYAGVLANPANTLPEGNPFGRIFFIALKCREMV